MSSVIEYMKRKQRATQKAAESASGQVRSNADANCPDPDGCEDALRAEAARLGIKLHHNNSTKTIRKKIDEYKAQKEKDDNVNRNDQQTGSAES